jgi:hypothetical protein
MPKSTKASGVPPRESESDSDSPEFATPEIGTEAYFGETEGEGGLRGRAADFMRRALVGGVGALFLTEEGIRNLVGELKLPKEIIGALLTQADRTKQEVVHTLGVELRRFFESAQLHHELRKLLTDVTIEIKAEVKLRPDSQEPSVESTKVHLRRGSSSKE